MRGSREALWPVGTAGLQPVLQPECSRATCQPLPALPGRLRENKGSRRYSSCHTPPVLGLRTDSARGVWTRTRTGSGALCSFTAQHGALPRDGVDLSASPGQSGRARLRPTRTAKAPGVAARACRMACPSLGAKSN